MTDSLLLPLVVQILFTIVILYALAAVRFKAIRSGQVKISDIALGQRAWPPKAQQVANCFQNQFETPLLFYIGILLALHYHIQSTSLVVLAWIFILCRFGHAYVEIGTNYVQYRFLWFVTGTTALLIFWINLVFQFMNN